MQTITVLLVDDHELVRSGLRRILRRKDGIAVVGECADGDEVAAAVEQAPHLRLCGLMAVAPLGEEPAAAFSRLAHVRQDFLANFPQATSLSAGMSGDLEDAVKIGATHLRVGSAILGSRPLAG